MNKNTDWLQGAETFLKEKQEMCAAQPRCENCPVMAKGIPCSLDAAIDAGRANALLDTIREWHENAGQPKTYLQDYAERLPRHRKDPNGAPNNCRDGAYGTSGGCEKYATCAECWRQPMKRK